MLTLIISLDVNGMYYYYHLPTKATPFALQWPVEHHILPFPSHPIPSRLSAAVKCIPRSHKQYFRQLTLSCCKLTKTDPLLQTCEN